MIKIEREIDDKNFKYRPEIKTKSDEGSCVTILEFIKSGRLRFKNMEEWRRVNEEMKWLQEQLLRGKTPNIDVNQIMGIFRVIPNEDLKKLLESIKN